MTLILIFIVIIILFLFVEIILINIKTNKIPLIIHVNGTRGKSSVTEYIATILRANGKNVLAKITGDQPTIIYPDGHKEIIRRFGATRVQEQVKLIRLSSKLSIDFLVVECMSIAGELQRIEKKLFKPNIYIITNIRNDHQEHFKDGIDEYAEAIYSAIPKNSIVITAETKYISEIKTIASKRNSKVIIANPKNLQGIPDGAFDSNIAIALEVSKIAGVNQNLALRKIKQSLGKEKLPVYRYKINGNSINFINGFSVNDVDSAKLFLNYWEKKLNGFDDKIIILNTRSDRPVRTLMFCQWISKFTQINKIIIIGSHTHYAKRSFIKADIKTDKILIWNKIKELDIIDNLNKLIGSRNITVIGLGNKYGENIWQTLKKE